MCQKRWQFYLFFSCVSEVLSYGVGEKTFEEILDYIKTEYFDNISEKGKKQFSGAFHLALSPASQTASLQVGGLVMVMVMW